MGAPCVHSHFGHEASGPVGRFGMARAGREVQEGFGDHIAGLPQGRQGLQRVRLLGCRRELV